MLCAAVEQLWDLSPGLMMHSVLVLSFLEGKVGRKKRMETEAAVYTVIPAFGEAEAGAS